MTTANGKSYQRDGDYLSTGQVCKTIGVSARTVATWFNQGEFPGGWRHNGGDRRIPRAALVAFCQRRGIALAGTVADPRPRLLAVGVLAELATEVAALLPEWSIQPARDAFEAGAAVASGVILAAVVVDAGELGADIARSILDHLAGTVERRAVLIPEDETGTRWAAAGCAVVRWPATAETVAKVLSDGLTWKG